MITLRILKIFWKCHIN